MSATCAFEIKSALKSKDIQSRVSAFWVRHNAREVYVSKLTEKNHYLCILSWFFFYPEEEIDLREVAKYLLSISTEQNIIYYRNGELVYEYNVDHPEPISINDLFRKELRPTMGGDPVPKEYNMPAGVFKRPPRYFVEKEKKEIPLIEAARIGDLEAIDALI